MSRRPHSGKKTNLSQFGLIDIPDLNDDDEPLDLSDDDIDLEAELAAISGGQQRRRPKKPPPTTSAVNLDAMIAESLKDIPSNDEASGDDDDPDLLNELQALSLADDDESPPPRAARPAPPPPGAPLSTDSSTISLLQDRITNYTVAEKNAKANGESSRARRFGRGLKTLQDLLKQAKAGKPIMNEDIPPPVVVGKAPDGSQRIPEEVPTSPAPQIPREAPEAPLIDFGPPEPSPASRSEKPRPPSPRPEEPSPPEPSSHRAETNEGLQIILARKNEFKVAALEAKRNGNKALALNLLKVTKQFDIVVEAYKRGEAMDLNELPTVAMFADSAEGGREDESIQSSEAPAPAPPVLVTATTLEEGLKQRLMAFRELESKAKEEGNMSKARRMNRITKQYADAIKQHGAGRPINTDELPAPAGFGPLPTAGRPPVAPPAPVATPSSERKVTKNEPLAYLLQEQRKFKEAALFFKKNDNIPAAKGLLRMVKYYDPIIEDARAGKRVHLDNVVVIPYSMRDLEARYGGGSSHSTAWVEELVNSVSRPRRQSTSSTTSGASSGVSGASGGSAGSGGSGGSAASGGSRQAPRASGSGAGPDDGIMAGALAADASIDTSASHDEVFSRLQHQLELQRQLCQAHYEHNMKIGNIAEAKKIEPMIQDISERLDVAFLEFKRRGVLPRFHYEMRQFSIVQCNTHLSDSDLELTIVRGIAYNVANPKDIDTYVKFEFPFPQEAPVSDRTVIVKDTNNPEYNQTFNLTINRTRACLRVFKRHGIKFEVWSRGCGGCADALFCCSGWFRSDALVGAATVKLAPLQDHITLHNSFPLMDGRRPTGGSLEVKLNVRTPLLQEQVKTTQHRWIVIED
ncbi:coiled-coil and C2 domain-containing protein 1-like isoform X2 [Trichoplusia ni]|uniref:Coiled-coil and C2 domain-containing protein 1-like isoform X2 n=1 Tax=Trichoplusia ni TaxID=7111 RepID=A0A7E5X3D3_TRINI|nr:coiled-coil and C2 domain-containing protein 1-like isoform X2 [Trichoplusia ni]